MKKYVLFAMIVLALAILVAACAAPASPAAPQPPAAEKPAAPMVLNLNMGAGDIPTIDPAVAQDTSSNQIIEEVTVGLSRQNEETAVTEPGLAKEWKRSDDGLKWTFTLNKDLGVTWVKYNAASGKVEQVVDKDNKPRPVTAKDFEYGFLRTLDPKNASPYAYVLNLFLKGAEAYNTADLKKASDDDLKKLRAAVGVKAVDDSTIEFTMLEANGFWPAVAGLWVGRAQPQWVIDEKGDRWTETGFQQSYGPYTMKEWVHDSKITLIANPFWPGTSNIPKPKIQEITWTMLDEPPALANYETGKLDVAVVPLTDIDRVKADAKLSKEFKVAPVLCTYYYGYNTKKAPMDNPKVRLAFSMAIDRQSLIDNVTKGGQEPAQWFTRPGLQASPTIKDNPNLGVKYDATKAKALLAEVYPDPSKMPEVTLMWNTNAGHKKIAEAIQQMWKKNLGVDVKLAEQEWKVFLKTVKSDAPQIYRLGWCQDYPDANNFLKEVFGKGGAYADAIGYSNSKFDDLLNQAFRETDMKKRIDLYSQAEDLFVAKDAAIAPIYWYTGLSVTKPYVTRTFSVLGGMQHIEKWTVARPTGQ